MFVCLPDKIVLEHRFLGVERSEDHTAINQARYGFGEDSDTVFSSNHRQNCLGPIRFQDNSWPEPRRRTQFVNTFSERRRGGSGGKHPFLVS
jgi:hypothetical protein